MPRVNLIQLRGGTAAAWTSANPVLDAREPGLETDTRKIKYGDGSTAWNSLSYSNGDQKQDALVSGTNIKTINGSSVLGSGDLAVTAAPLTVIAGTDAAVTMLVNRHYELNGSILTADRNYTLPTPTATGDRIRVSLTNGNASYECIIKGNTGITVNGGSAGAEWSRLFIAREYVEFRATDATNWDVWDDGRIECEFVFSPGSNITLTNSTWTAINFTTQENLVGITNSSGVYSIRRSGAYLMGQEYYISNAGSSLSSSTAYALWVAITKNGDTSTGTFLTLVTKEGTGGVTGFVYPSVGQPAVKTLVAGDTIRWSCLQSSGADKRIDALTYNTIFCRELL